MASLSVKYRPTKFEDVVAQSSIIQILNKQIETKNFRNCYIFSGPSGCGKTTLARIFANKINNGQGTPIEIDAASNNGVENIRQITNSAMERALDSEYKVYIIDEAHMLTVQSWNALLKCIEEPPKYTMFIFCTTDFQKIIPTIVNRCQKFTLTKIPTNKIYERLCYICKNEHVINYTAACDHISKISNGGLRDAISTLEKCIDYSNDLTLNNIYKVIGSFDIDTFIDLTNAIIDNNAKEIIHIIDNYNNECADFKIFIDELLSFYLDINKYILFKDLSVTKIPKHYLEKVNFLINFDNNINYYNYLLNNILEIKNEIKNVDNIYEVVLVMLLKIARCE